MHQEHETKSILFEALGWAHKMSHELAKCVWISIMFGATLAVITLIII